MLLALFQWLAQDMHVRAFNVFTYITLRAVLAALTALAISFIVGPGMIRQLTAYKIGQAVRDDGPQSHLIKAGTPTMGGALILVAILIATLLWMDLKNIYVWVVMLVTAGFGAVGWVDDYRKVVHRNPKGLSAKAKYFWQSLIALVAVAFIAYSTKLPAQTELIRFLRRCLFP
jgi:phospho-N-acetylmuramoyl-pentapeptide-transferase